MKLSNVVKEYWATKKVLDLGYKVKLTETNGKYGLQILFDDGDVYADFKIIEFIDEKFTDEIMYFVYEDNEIINNEMEDTFALDECIKGCFYRFCTMY